MKMMESLLDSSSAGSGSDDSASSDKEVLAVLCEMGLDSRVFPYTRLNLEDVTPLECEQPFRCILNRLILLKIILTMIQCIACTCRFQKANMTRLLRVLEIPPKYYCPQGTTASGIESLMIVLRRLAYPNRLSDLVPIFGRSKTELSFIFNTVSIVKIVRTLHVCVFFNLLQILNDLHDRFSHLLTSFDLVWLDKAEFASAVQRKGAPLTACIGFIDGTTRPITRPIINQQVMFNGHKRIHCLKFQVY